MSELCAAAFPARYEAGHLFLHNWALKIDYFDQKHDQQTKQSKQFKVLLILINESLEMKGLPKRGAPHSGQLSVLIEIGV